MKIVEMAKKGSGDSRLYALVASTAPASLEELNSELAELENAVLQWRQARKESAERVLLNVVSEAANRQPFLDSIANRHATPDTVLRGVRVDVAMLDKTGRPVDERTL
jgi:hypothetical protein